ncbi:MAG: Dabb family protein [Opitutaceae bacterium]|nr:Dabb family protein [Opitutaceae bacterium]
MLIHSVYFWLKPELTPAQRAEFLTALEALKDVPSVKQFYLGKPAGVTPRPVVDLTFDYSITCVFADVAGHNAYQVHPLHLAFVNTGKPLWTKVQIYDAE